MADDDAGLKVPDALLVATLLLPGFLSVRVADYFTDTPKVEEFELLASALAFTLVDISAALGVAWSIARTRGRPLRRLQLTSPAFLGGLAALSIGMGALWAVIDSNDVLYKLHLTNRETRHSVFYWVVDEYRDRPFAESRYVSWVRLVTADGIVYHGHPRLYSGGLEEGAILLRPAFREVQSMSPGATPATMPPVPERVAPRAAPNAECRSVPDGVYVSAGAIRFMELRTIEKQAAYSCDDEAPALAVPAGPVPLPASGP